MSSSRTDGDSTVDPLNGSVVDFQIAVLQFRLEQTALKPCPAEDFDLGEWLKCSVEPMAVCV